MRKVRAAFAVFACGLTLNAGSTVITTDLTSSANDWEYVSDGLGQSFTPSAAYTLSSITVVLSVSGSIETGRPVGKHARAHKSVPARSTPAISATAPAVTVQLWSDNGQAPPHNAPGTLLASSGTVLYDYSMTSNPSQYVFPISYALTANTRYWVEVVTAPGNSTSQSQWWGSDTPSGSDIAPEYWIDVLYGNAVSTQDPFAYLLAVTVLSGAVPGTPAPPSFWLALIGLTGAGFYWRRRRLALNARLS